MIEPAVVAAVVVVGGGILAVSSRDGRVVAIGLLIAMGAAPLVASSFPQPLSVAARIVGAVLAGYLFWAAASGGRISGAGSAIGLAAETAVAVAAFAIGMSVSLVDPLPGPTVAQAAGLTLIVLAVVPVFGRDVLRVGAGFTLLVLGCTLLTAAWLGETPPLAKLAVASLLVGIAAASYVGIAMQPLPGGTVAAGKREIAATSGIESTAGQAGVATPSAAGRARIQGSSEGIGTRRDRTTPARYRSKISSEQTSAWAEIEKSEPETPPESPPSVAAPPPATRIVRPSDRPKP